MSPETRDFLATVRRAEDPSPNDEARVLAALEATVAGALTGNALAGAPATKGVASAAGPGLKLIGALLGVSVGSALVAVAISNGAAPPTVASPQHSGHVSVSHAPAPSSAAPAPSSVPPSSAASARGVSARSPVAVPPEVRQATEPPAPSSTTRARSASLRDEIALLAGVQAALERGDGAEALRQLDQHTSGDRQLVAERRAARIAALCLLGRVSEAQALAAVFFREHAHSVQRPAVERSCAATKTHSQR
jgi:hypothetical protein